MCCQSRAVGVEIERKFVVPDPPRDLERHASKQIDQGYLVVSGDAEVRIRSLGDERFLTVKRGSGMERAELEIEISDQQFQALWKLVEGRHVTKRRFYVPLGALTAEVDVYGGELDGLITAEVEFESMDAGEGFEPPEWFGAEVTDDDRFANQSLAQAARPPDQAP